MILGMCCMIFQLKIIDRIVRLVFILMVNIFIITKKTT